MQKEREKRTENTDQGSKLSLTKLSKPNGLVWPWPGQPICWEHVAMASVQLRQGKDAAASQLDAAMPIETLLAHRGTSGHPLPVDIRGPPSLAISLLATFSRNPLWLQKPDEVHARGRTRACGFPKKGGGGED